ncbi:MAG: hypothetical protein QOG55_533 [Acidobacteriaceae bacterium]|jgi:uncharacterized protein (DUF488 family)|nr:hypothetical protein [Acidobacteriaceae bacterium]
MRRLLCTIGFTGKTAEDFFDLLRHAEVQSVIDVRQNRTGQLSAFAKYPDLEFFLRQIGNIGYRHEPLLAPTPELRKSYQKGKDWAAYEKGFLNLLKQRAVPQSLDTSSWPANVGLLCTEPGPEKCHRRLVADVLTEQWRAAGDDVEVRHLVSSTKRGKRQQHGIAS